MRSPIPSKPDLANSHTADHDCPGLFSEKVGAWRSQGSMLQQLKEAEQPSLTGKHFLAPLNCDWTLDVPEGPGESPCSREMFCVRTEASASVLKVLVACRALCSVSALAPREVDRQERQRGNTVHYRDSLCVGRLPLGEKGRHLVLVYMTRYGVKVNNALKRVRPKEPQCFSGSSLLNVMRDAAETLFLVFIVYGRSRKFI